MSEFNDLRGDVAASPSRRIEVPTIGDAWIGISAVIMESGVESSYDALAIREVIMPTLVVTAPRSDDEVVKRYANAQRLEWMHENFTRYDRVTALGDADSYATRLRNYDHSGRDQIEWVINRLRSDPLTRSATITTFQPLTDTDYIPCVSLLDFFLIDNALHLSCYAHSIDFGAKGYGNLVELASLQEQIAREVGCAVGTLTMFIKSAHVYESDFAYMDAVLSTQRHPD
jgi:thymidylate synthase